MQQVQYHEIMLDGQYQVVHQFGDGYSGPGGGRLFVYGLIDGPMTGAEIRASVMASCALFYPWADGNVARWDGRAWSYEAPEPPAKPSKPAPKAEPKDKPKKPSKRRGRPKGSKNKKRRMSD